MGYPIPITTQVGRGGMYAGQRRQVGGSFFGTIRRLAIPLLQKLWPSLQSIGKQVGKSALSIGTGLAGDLISGKARQIPQNLRKRGREEINSLTERYVGQKMFDDVPPPNQTGSGGRKKKRKAPPVKSINMKRLQAAKKKRTALDKDIFS